MSKGTLRGLPRSETVTSGNARKIRQAAEEAKSRLSNEAREMASDLRQRMLIDGSWPSREAMARLFEACADEIRPTDPKKDCPTCGGSVFAPVRKRRTDGHWGDGDHVRCVECNRIVIKKEG